jgi:hypothetical protein
VIGNNDGSWSLKEKPIAKLALSNLAFGTTIKLTKTLPPYTVKMHSPLFRMVNR